MGKMDTQKRTYHYRVQDAELSEESECVATNAVVKDEAMVVHLINAPAALAAVMGELRLHSSTLLACILTVLGGPSEPRVGPCTAQSRSPGRSVEQDHHSYHHPGLQGPLQVLPNVKSPEPQSLEEDCQGNQAWHHSLIRERATAILLSLASAFCSHLMFSNIIIIQED
jgi:hypothetical protein